MNRHHRDNMAPVSAGVFFCDKIQREIKGGNNAMPIWKLEPVDPTADHWRCSTWFGTVFIRAKDELAAREMVQNAYGVAPAVTPPGAETPLLPWIHDLISTCEQVEDSAYDTDGPDEILSPE